MRLRPSLPERPVLVAAALSAVLLFLAQQPVGFAPLVFVALVPFVATLDRMVVAGRPLREVLWAAYWFGVCAFGLELYWMVIALWHFTPLSLAGYLASILVVLAPRWALTAWIVVRVRRGTALPPWLVFPLAWTAVEWIGAHLGDLRFPWLGLGTSLGGLPVLAQWADVAGARGLTLWIVAVNVLAYGAVRAWAAGRRRAAMVPLLVMSATVLLAWGYGTWRMATTVMRPVTTVAVLQPNVGFDEKRNSRDEDSLVLQLLDLTRRATALPGVRLVAWPEAAVGFFYEHPDWEAWVGEVARQARIPIVAGALDVEFGPGGSYEYYNAAFIFDTTGSARHQPVYRKTYLVPIVERVPFLNPRWFGQLKWFGGFGRGDRFPVYRLPEGGYGVLICYESAFEGLARGYRRDGADFLVNITNDAWFGRTAAPYQHAAHLVLRAIETRMGIARAANTGISEFVDPLGRVHGRTVLNTEVVAAGEVLTTDGETLYVRLGDWVAALALAGVAAMLVAAWTRRSPRGETP